MSSSKGRFCYWDSNIFLAYINQEPGRVGTIDSLWEEIEKENGGKVVTSTVSIVEVAAAAQERIQKQLDAQAELKIDGMWQDPTVLLVESPEVVMRIARKLIRDALPAGWRLHPKDAIHLATAVWVDRNVHSVTEFHTYDGKLAKFNAMTGLTICEPNIAQPRLLPPGSDTS
jgi:predicted nucleic acid-binding protein